MLKKTRCLNLGIMSAAFMYIGLASNANSSTLITQTALPGDCIPQFTVPLPVFGPAGPIPRVDALKHPRLEVTAKEIDQAVLPLGQSDTCNMGLTFGKTRVYGYEIRDAATNKPLAPANWPAVTVEAWRNAPTLVQFVNELPSFNPGNPTGPGMVQGLVTVDQTIDWTDPLMTAMANGCTQFPQAASPLNAACLEPYTGPQPSVPHLHGAEVPSQYDGGPMAWFTPAASNIHGMDFSSLYNAGPGKAVYLWQNSQEPGTLWFHDHSMGQTRTNVYSGLAAFYFLRDPANEPTYLPSGPYEIELAIQDRQFDTNSQLYFPDGSGADAATSNLNGTPPNPQSHPFWIPEFIGDVAIVNGAPWPYFNVEPRRYRFRIIEGSNARGYNLTFGGAPIYFIGSDDNYLDKPVPASSVFILPGERADIIVDFTNYAGKSIDVTNNAPVPFPMGLMPGVDQPGMAKIMRFNVTTPRAGVDGSCNPGTGARGGCQRPTKMVRLTDGNGHLARGVVIDKKRQLVLKEYEGAGGPMMVFTNNTSFDGRTSPSIDNIFPGDGVSELPRQGSTELWEIINLTMDAHPIHTHLVQFQVLNREYFNNDPAVGYQPLAWAAAFPADTSFSPLCTGGVFCPGYGPPLAYNVPNGDHAIGGNPAISPYLLGNATPPDAWESGWKDTAKVMPGQVRRMVVRVTPTSTKVTPEKSLAGHNFFPFDPTNGPGYVWHCHIVDHEDQDMMRPYKVTK